MRDDDHAWKFDDDLHLVVDDAPDHLHAVFNDDGSHKWVDLGHYDVCPVCNDATRAPSVHPPEQ